MFVLMTRLGPAQRRNYVTVDDELVDRTDDPRYPLRRFPDRASATAAIPAIRARFEYPPILTPVVS